MYKFRNYWSPEQIKRIPMFKKQLLDLIWLLVYWVSEEDESRLFSLVSCDRTNSNDRKFNLKIRKSFSMVNVIKHWSRLPSEVFLVSIHGDTQNRVKHGCEKPAAAAPSLNKDGPGCAPVVLFSLWAWSREFLSPVGRQHFTRKHFFQGTNWKHSGFCCMFRS